MPPRRIVVEARPKSRINALPAIPSRRDPERIGATPESLLHTAVSVLIWGALHATVRHSGVVLNNDTRSVRLAPTPSSATLGLMRASNGCTVNGREDQDSGSAAATAARRLPPAPLGELERVAEPLDCVREQSAPARKTARLAGTTGVPRE
jgi:hypothetical protein